MPRREPLALVVGLPDPRLTAGAFFDGFPWTPRGPDAARLSAQAFLELLETAPRQALDVKADTLKVR